MKRVFATLCVLFVAFGFLYAKDPLEGCWKSIDDETGVVTAYWKIYQVEGELRGEIMSIPEKPADTVASAVESSYKGHPCGDDTDLSKEPVIGTPWIWGLSSTKIGEWRNGSIVDAGNGSRYTCAITFHAAGSKISRKKLAVVDTLEMRGSIGFIGRSQYWERADESEFNAN
ncbi:MAG TPA: DUF2147 domain-containing protein [Treponemataceae bacterium]|nr:DUF2147 domain-containing protein [Treponemataceae bacterium]